MLRFSAFPTCSRPILSHLTIEQADPHIDAAEMAKCVTTSIAEAEGPLVQRLLHDPRNRQRMMRHHAMYIMADLGDEHAVAGSQVGR